jgi:hypothetical protein
MLQPNLHVTITKPVFLGTIYASGEVRFWPKADAQPEWQVRVRTCRSFGNSANLYAPKCGSQGTHSRIADGGMPICF